MYFRIGILRAMIRVFKNVFCIIIIYAIGNVGIITVFFNRNCYLVLWETKEKCAKHKNNTNDSSNANWNWKLKFSELISLSCSLSLSLTLNAYECHRSTEMQKVWRVAQQIYRNKSAKAVKIAKRWPRHNQIHRVETEETQKKQQQVAADCWRYSEPVYTCVRTYWHNGNSTQALAHTQKSPLANRSSSAEAFLTDKKMPYCIIHSYSTKYVCVCGKWEYGLKSKPEAFFKAALITVSFVGLR